MRQPLRHSIVLLFLSTIVASMSFGQSEAESAPSNGVVQSRTNGRTKDVNIGQSIRYRLDGEKRYSKRSTFKGIAGDIAIIGQDSVRIEHLGSIRVRDDQSYDSGKKLAVVSLLLPFVIALVSRWLGLSAIPAIGPIVIVTYILTLLSFLAIPIIIVGLIMMLAASNTFEVKRFWRFKAKKHSTKPDAGS